MKIKGIKASLASVTLLSMLAAALPNGAYAKAASDHLSIGTDHGAVRGTNIWGVEAFLGIPYAAPPVGPLRWRPPQPAAAWSGVRPAAVFGAACPQKATLDSRHITDENCLFVNVERPVGTTANSKLPVFVFIHGGGFTTGSGNNENPEKIVRETGVVAVTMNYRLGVLGFLAHPALSAEDPAKTSGNYGFEDQQAALRWVQANIAKFGGDPARVTIGGESAGGMSICGHLTSPGSRGLFSQAIIQSGSCSTQTQQQAEDTGIHLANAVMCPDEATAAACLRAKPVDDLLDSPGISSRFVRGTPSFPGNPERDLRTGQFTHVPVLVGATRNEGRSFQRLSVGMSQSQYEAQVRSTMGSNADAVLKEYPWPDQSERATAAYLLGDITTDGGKAAGIGGCSLHGMVQSFAKYVPTYAYEWSPPATGTAWYTIPGYQWGAGHATELPYLFPRRNGGANAAVFSPEEQQLSHDLIQYWGAFIKTGHPAVASLAAWPTYQEANAFMALRVAGRSALISDNDFTAEHKCDFWQSLPDRAMD